MTNHSEQTRLRVADFLVRHLYSEGVKHFFTVTGRGALFLTDGLARNQELIKSISLHHEQSCSFAAVAYAQTNDNFGACMVSTGCASTNTLTGVLSAWQDGIPCIFISGQNTLAETTRHTGHKIRTYGQQEADIISIVSSITKYAVMLENPNDIAYELDKCIFHAKSGRKGPVWLDIPLDLQSSIVEPKLLKRYKPKFSLPKANQKHLNYTLSEINKSQRPVLLVGHGVRSSGAIKELETFVKKISIPVVYTFSSPDIYPLKNKMSIGSVGSMGCSRAGNFSLQNSDLIIVIGSRLSSLTTGIDFCKFGREAKIIVVDIDPLEHQKESIVIDQFIHSDAKDFLTKINTLDIKKTTSNWVKKNTHWKKIFPKLEPLFDTKGLVDIYQLSQTLSKQLDHSANVVTDSGLIEVILPNNLDFGPNRRCIHPAYQGSMGFALPASIGAYYSNKKQTVAIIGDGSVMMNLQELQSIAFHKLPIKIIIINNDVYSIIRRRQAELFRKRTIGTDPSNGVSCPSFKSIAKSFNLKYMKIKTSKDLNSKIKMFLNSPDAGICEIFGKPNQNYIEQSRIFNQSRRLVQRPLEDQYPFLDRDIFLKEMIIKPIDQ